MVSPAATLMPSTPISTTSRFSPASDVSASGPTSSYDSGRATPPVTTSFRLGRTASSDAMLSELVTTVRPRRSDSARAASVVVVPPVMPTAAPSGTRSAAARAIRAFCSWWRALR